ncbi:RagB/SusD family nutrient uptake outer membrane protein [Sphingobacterium siyangense]|uniref:RagB/SusD family nutrient uptake outer membrane protein n=1 Tax=Sphingobacterium siyangense TaxID=459529 RepID=UPI00196381FE|nr:RagB/SusD family nutrient uptake outer membrane protein [Sphingobacterium siyangense]QRY58620.1 RagB/SusD family nutrient uptake outer membrane protein [Sphingobacterium siyangense]
MKKYIYLLICLLVPVFFGACSKYLDVDLANQKTLDETFQKRTTTERYLAQVYGYLPIEHDLFNSEGGNVPLSDEALFSWVAWVPWLNFTNGGWGVTTDDYATWVHNYQGINQATIFINNVDKNVELNESTKSIMKAEARFLRAYFYYLLLKRYGPVFVWGDRAADDKIDAKTVDRMSLEANVNFILSEFDKATAVLPKEITDQAWYGRLTKGAVMAAKSELLLYMARPLFNGAKLYVGLKNRNGEFLFPQTVDPTKWELAAQAAKDLIDLNLYTLYQDNKETNNFRRAIKSYMGIYFEKWNSEIIWGRWSDDGFNYNVRTAPPRVVTMGWGGYAPSLKLVDSYPMASSGRYPITGYSSNGQPIIDEKSGYQETGFTDNYVHPLDNFAAFKAHNSCVGRDARFYASILANGMYWINRLHGDKKVTFFDGGTSTYTKTGDCVKSGYLWRRMSDPTNDIESGNWGQFAWPFYRLAEIYLNYAEACNEKPNRNETEALKYVNLVRQRSGLNKLEEAYPEVLGNKELLRGLLRKERMVEMAFEGHRYPDLRTWMIAEQEMNEPYYTRNVAATTYEASWERTKDVFPGKRVFQAKHYFFPIHQQQLSEMVNMTQNYGW